MNFRWFVSVCCFAFASPTPASADAGADADWPQWRGPTRDGRVSAGAPAWPDTLKAPRLTLKWRIPLGEGYPGPIVVADRVFVAETKDRKQEIVRAVARRDGKELWSAKWDGAMTVPFFAAENGSWIRATPACDGESLFVPGMLDELVCFDAKTGAERWRKAFHREYGKPDFGAASSPLPLGDFLYHQAANGLLKIEKKTGAIVWRKLESKGGMMTGGAFSSPAAATLGGVPQLLVQTRTMLAGVDPETGEALWKQDVPAFRGMNILTPQAFGDGVFTSTYQNKSFFYRPRKGAAGWTVGTGWENKARGYMSSPVVVGGHLYMHTQDRRCVCIELDSGALAWTSGRTFGKYWSMAVNGDKILALDQNGELLLLKADPKAFTLLDRRKVSDAETWGHVAVAGDEIYVRELKGLAAYVWK